MHKPPQEKIWNRHFIIAAVITLFVGLAMSMINSTMARYIYSLFGSATFSGWLNAAFAVMAVIARLVAGDLSDRRGRQRVLIFGCVIFAVSIFCFGVFPIAGLLIIFRGLQGFGYAVATTADNAAGADVVPEERMSEGVGYLGIGYSLSTAIGSAVALSLMTDESYMPVIWGATGVVAAALLLAFALRYERLPFYKEKMERQKKAGNAKDLSEYRGISRIVEKRALPATLVQLFNCTSWAAVNSFIVLFADHRGIENVAMFFTFVAAAMLATRLFAGKLTDRFGELAIGVPALLVNIAGFVVIVCSKTALGIYIAGFMIGLGNGTTNPIMQAAAVKLSPANRRGAASGTYQMSNDIANGAGAVLWGIVIDALSYEAMFIGCCATSFLSLVCLIYFFRKKKYAELMKKR